jgi:hypothetical protein
MTALQELMQWFNERPEYDKTSEGYEIMQKAQELLTKEAEQLKEMYLRGIENYDPTFKRKSQWEPVTKINNNERRV